MRLMFKILKDRSGEKLTSFGMGLWLVEKDRYEIVRDSERLVTF